MEEFCLKELDIKEKINNLNINLKEIKKKLLIENIHGYLINDENKSDGKKINENNYDYSLIYY